MKKNNRKGFTIVELVIVIAVIAILAAVLIPTFSGIVNKANQSARQQEVAAALKSMLVAETAQFDTDKYTYTFYITKGDKVYAYEYSAELGNFEEEEEVTAKVTATEDDGAYLYTKDGNNIPNTITKVVYTESDTATEEDTIIKVEDLQNVFVLKVKN
jgi:type IV pilus assembly protein PilA